MKSGPSVVHPVRTSAAARGMSRQPTDPRVSAERRATGVLLMSRTILASSCLGADIDLDPGRKSGARGHARGRRVKGYADLKALGDLDPVAGGILRRDDRVDRLFGGELRIEIGDVEDVLGQLRFEWRGNTLAEKVINI